MITFRWESPSYTTDILLCDESKKLDALQKVYIVANSQFFFAQFFCFVFFGWYLLSADVTD